DGQRVQVVGRTPPRGGIKLKVPAGPHAIGVAVVRTSNPRGVDDLFSELASTAGVNSVGINGPINATGPGDTPSRRKIFICRPAESRRSSPEITASEVGCAPRILSSLATRAMRRPVSEKDPSVDMLLGFYESGHKLRGFEAGIQY